MNVSPSSMTKSGWSAAMLPTAAAIRGELPRLL